MTGWTIAHVIPMRFDSSQATGLSAAFELRVRARRAGAPLRFTLRIDDGVCHVTRHASAGDDAGAVATVGLADLIRLSLGLVGWPRLMATGRLELSGDPFLALRFPSLFRLRAQPRIARPRA